MNALTESLNALTTKIMFVSSSTPGGGGTATSAVAKTGDFLGNGELTKKLTVQANAFSASAKEKIEALGGKAEVI